MTSIGLLIAPSMRHRLADSGEDTTEGLHATTLLAGLALLPLACGLSLDVSGMWCPRSLLDGEGHAT
jgi:hypothetical protein